MSNEVNEVTKEEEDFLKGLTKEEKVYLEEQLTLMRLIKIREIAAYVVGVKLNG